MRVIKKSHRCIIVLHTSNRSSWNEELAGITRYGRSAGWNVQVIERYVDRKTLRELVEFWHPDGVIAECGVDPRGIFNAKTFGAIPTVLLVCDPARLDSKSLAVDHDSASIGRIAAKEFLSAGFRNFAYAGFAKLFWSEARLNGYRDALLLNGFDCKEFERTIIDEDKATSERKEYQRFTDWLVSLPKPCGLLAANDMLAIECENLCRAARIDVPREISIIGIDNDVNACENAIPTLTSIRPDFEAAGFMAAQLLDDKLERGKAFKGERIRRFPAAGIVQRASSIRCSVMPPDVIRALEYIRLNACSGIHPDDVFAVMGRKKRLAEMRFRDIVGHTVQKEINSIRLARAKELLARRDMPIGSIAAECGWKATSQLRAYFRVVEGVSMREWRKHS